MRRIKNAADMKLTKRKSTQCRAREQLFTATRRAEAALELARLIMLV